MLRPVCGVTILAQRQNLAFNVPAFPRMRRQVVACGANGRGVERSTMEHCLPFSHRGSSTCWESVP